MMAGCKIPVYSFWASVIKQIFVDVINEMGKVI